MTLQKEFVQALQKGFHAVEVLQKGFHAVQVLQKGLLVWFVLPVQYEKFFNDP